MFEDAEKRIKHGEQVNVLNVTGESPFHAVLTKGDPVLFHMLAKSKAVIRPRLPHVMNELSE
jgi:hypothetical protein